MLTGLKMSSVACKCVFYRSEHNAKSGPMELNFHGPEMQKRNIPTGRAHEQMKKFDHLPSYHVISRVMVIKMSKIAHFFVFSADGGKKSVTVCVRYLSSFRKCYEL